MDKVTNYRQIICQVLKDFNKRDLDKYNKLKLIYF